MAGKKQKTKGSTTLKPQSDPWLKWSAPAQGADVQELILEYGLDDEMPMFDWPLDSIEFTNTISDAANDIVPDEEPDIEKHPIPELESLRIVYSVSPMSVWGEPQEFTMSEVSERIFNTLKMLKDVWPHPKAVRRLKDVARKLVGLLNEAKELGRKKIELAHAMKRKDAAAKMEKAYDSLCMTDLTGDIDTDAKRLFLERKITPDEFHAAMRRAFVLDRQATKEINDNGANTPLQPQAAMGSMIINAAPGSTVIMGNTSRADNSKKHRDRAKGVTDEWIASEFNSHALELIREKKDDGRIVYEKKRGGGGGNYRVGTCSKRTVQDWIKKYPDAYHVEPKSGFHAGMLTDKKQIEDAARRWEKYWSDYATAFYYWRQVNKYAPREHFRYDPDKIIHQDNISVEADIPRDMD